MAHVHLNQTQMNGLLQVSATFAATKTVSGAAAQAVTGLVEITATGHGYSSGNIVYLASVGGTTEANGLYGPIVVIDANHFTIPVTFVNAYTSGGTAQLMTPAGAAISGISTVTGGFTGQLVSGDLYNLYDSCSRTVESATAIGTTLATAP